MMHRKNKIILFAWGIFICAFPLFLYDAIFAMDNLFMYAHGKDMLENGLVRDFDIFSIHEGLSMMYQKWISCIFVYKIGSLFGMHSIVTAGYVFLFLLMLSIFYVCIYFDRSNILFETCSIFCCEVLFAMNGHIEFRPHMIALIIFVWMIFVLERYARGEIKNDTKFYLFFVSMSVLLMWTHSTMWIMYVLVFLPYLCNFEFIYKLCGKCHFSVSGRQYQLKPLIKACVLMFVSGILNPNGIKQYAYMYWCMTAVGSKYKHVDELRPIAPLAYLFLMAFFFFLFYCIYEFHCKRKIVVYMPSLCFIAGSLLMPIIASRLLIYSAVFVVIAFALQMSYIYECDGSPNIYEFDIKNKTMWIITVALIVYMIATSVMDNEIDYQFAAFSFSKDLEHNYLSDSVNWILDNNPSVSTVFTTTEFIGSYCIYKGLHPYADCRQELYDININHKKDILSDIEDMTNDTYHGMKLSEGGLEALDEEYHFDYYIVTMFSDSDIYIQSALEEYGAECVYTSGESIGIVKVYKMP